MSGMNRDVVAYVFQPPILRNKLSEIKQNYEKGHIKALSVRELCLDLIWTFVSRLQLGREEDQDVCGRIIKKSKFDNSRIIDLVLLVGASFPYLLNLKSLKYDLNSRFQMNSRSKRNQNHELFWNIFADRIFNILFNERNSVAVSFSEVAIYFMHSYSLVQFSQYPRLFEKLKRE